MVEDVKFDQVNDEAIAVNVRPTVSLIAVDLFVSPSTSLTVSL